MTNKTESYLTLSVCKTNPCFKLVFWEKKKRRKNRAFSLYIQRCYTNTWLFRNIYLCLFEKHANLAACILFKVTWDHVHLCSYAIYYGCFPCLLACMRFRRRFSSVLCFQCWIKCSTNFQRKCVCLSWIFVPFPFTTIAFPFMSLLFWELIFMSLFWKPTFCGMPRNPW